MTRGAVIGFLVLAALVGAAETLGDKELTALGEPLVRMQDRIAADSSYQSLARLTASPGCLWTKVDVVNTYDACDGPSYDYNGYTEGPPAIPLPLDSGYYAPSTYYTSYTDNGSWDNYALPNVGGITPYAQGVNGVLDQYNYQDGYTTYTSTGASLSYQEAPSYGASTYQGAGGGNVYYTSGAQYGQTYPNDLYTIAYGSPIVGVPQGTTVGTSLSYGTPTYQDVWYTQAFPGVGQAIVPILPSIFQPVSYNANSYSIVAAQPYPTGYYAQQNYPTPSCTIRLSPTQINYGGSTVVSWASDSATNAALQDYGSVALSGSKTLSGQTTSRTIGLSVSNGARSGACYALLQVGPQAATQPHCVISAYPDIIKKGQSASIAWRADNASNASLTGYGSVAREGGRTISPNQTTTYVLSVSGGGTTTSCSATVVVQ